MSRHGSSTLSELSQIMEGHGGPHTREVDEFVRQNLRQIGNGGNRHVYKLPDSEGVVKIPFMRTVGIQQNKHEHKTWEKFKSTPIGDHLAPVIDAHPNGYWLVMEYAEPTNKGSGAFEDERVSTMREVFREFGLHTLCQSDELGWYNGRLVLLDYGESVHT